VWQNLNHLSGVRAWTSETWPGAFTCSPDLMITWLGRIQFEEDSAEQMLLAHFSWWTYAAIIGFFLVMFVLRSVNTWRQRQQSAELRIVMPDGQKIEIVGTNKASDAKKIADALISALGNTDPKEIKSR